jgi:hypothetical protein
MVVRVSNLILFEQDSVLSKSSICHTQTYMWCWKLVAWCSNWLSTYW